MDEPIDMLDLFDSRTNLSVDSVVKMVSKRVATVEEESWKAGSGPGLVFAACGTQLPQVLALAARDLTPARCTWSAPWFGQAFASTDVIVT